MEPRVGSDAYEQRKRALIKRAQTDIYTLTVGAGSGAVPDLGRQHEVRALLAAFRLKFIPDMMLDVALITALIDGPEAATTSKFSV